MVERHIRELDRLRQDLGVLEREIAETALDDPAVKRLMTITGVDLTVAAGLMAAISNIVRFTQPKETGVSGLEPKSYRCFKGIDRSRPFMYYLLQNAA